MTKLAKPIYRPHNEKLHQPDGTKVKSRQDWTERCAAGRPAKECPFPVAKAFDANDKSLSVRTRKFLVDVDGRAVLKEVKNVDFTKRSTYLFKYDAKDAANNHAEQVVFALVLDDQTAPKIAVCRGSKQLVEAASKWTLCQSFANDNIDRVVTDNVQYTIAMIPDKSNLVWAKKNLPNKPKTLVENVKYAGAKYAIDTDVVGRYLLTLRVSDKAGVYGKGSKSNTQIAKQAIFVHDTTKPTITIHGAQPAIEECGVEGGYKDEGAFAADSLDTAKLGRKIPVSRESSVNIKKVGWYKVTYNAKDVAGNQADTAVRRVRVKDHTAPRIYLKGKAEMEVWAGQNKKGDKHTFDMEPGVTTFDLCDKRKLPVTMRWIGVNGKFDDSVPGVYTRQYCVSDHVGLKNCITRKINVSDKRGPQITIQGNAIETFEASRDITYTDKGAKCQDYVDGDIGHAVEVSGEVVNMARPATYTIRYDCADSRGNTAQQQIRKVVIEDTTCPVLKMKGANTAYVEAGFPYKDAGATATDTLDGDLTNKVWTDGNSVDAAMSFMNLRSCRDIKRQWENAKTAEYYVTTYNKQSKKYEQITVWCDMQTSKNTAYTYHAIKKGKRVVPYSEYGREGAGLKSQSFSASNANSCWQYGLEMAKFTSEKQKVAAQLKFGKLFFPSKGASSDMYLCSTNDQFKVSKVIASSKQLVKKAQVGKYVIAFHVQDKAGNTEASCPGTKTQFRTVVVKDTLAPVISLHFNNKVRMGKKNAKESWSRMQARTRNPAELKWGKPYRNPQMMAEQSVSVNGWVIAAVASAVAGVALLAQGSKTPQTTVPV